MKIVNYQYIVYLQTWTLCTARICGTVFMIVWINWRVSMPDGTASTRIWPRDHITGIALITIMTTMNIVNDGSMYFNHTCIFSCCPFVLSNILFNIPENNTIEDSRRTA